MNDKKLNLSNGVLSLMRIECLLEELIFQTILTRQSDISNDAANERFMKALQNVDNSMKERVEELPDAE